MIKTRVVKVRVVKIENDNDWEYVFIDLGDKKVMAVF